MIPEVLNFLVVAGVLEMMIYPSQQKMVSSFDFLKFLGVFCGFSQTFKSGTFYRIDIFIGLFLKLTGEN